jgi:peptide/nickel transport system permease protein
MPPDTQFVAINAMPAATRERPAWLRGLSLIASSAPATIGIALVLFWTFAALLAPWLAPFPPNASDLAALAHPTPSARHWLGTDSLGRDMLSRILWGARTVMTVAPVAVLGATALGSLVGLVAGYHRGWIDIVITRISDIVLSFPVIILYMIILAIYGSSAFNIIAVITLTKAPIIARIVRGITLELRGREYVAAAKMRGESALAIMLTEILPNARGPLIVDMCLRMGYTIITIGVLGFLGIGLPPPDPDWGGMVKDSYGMMSVWPHMSLIPCAAISSLAVGFNLLAVGLREIGQRD